MGNIREPRRRLGRPLHFSAPSVHTSILDDRAGTRLCQLQTPGACPRSGRRASGPATPPAVVKRGSFRGRLLRGVCYIGNRLPDSMSEPGCAVQRQLCHRRSPSLTNHARSTKFVSPAITDSVSPGHADYRLGGPGTTHAVLGRGSLQPTVNRESVSCGHRKVVTTETGNAVGRARQPRVPS